jgi:NADPH:quinone reductase-like Zn-dependent oxidoreductase
MASETMAKRSEGDRKYNHRRETMKIVRIHSFGGPAVLKIEDLPLPTLGEEELLVRVVAASVNPVDYKIREGRYPAVKADRLPYSPGRDIAGIVEDSGGLVDDWKQGDAVYAMLGIDRGGYAEFAIVTSQEVAPKPKTLDFVAAASVPLAGLTAWQGLFRYGELKAGQRVLIHGGSGGVGHFAIQFAKAAGAYVITTVSQGHADFVRSLGADEVIDYKTQRFEDVAKDVDLVYDLIGGETQERSWNVLKRGGTLVSTLSEPSQEQARANGVRALRYTVKESGAELEEIGRLIDAGKVKPRITKTFQLVDAANAQLYVEEGHTEGKVVLEVAA